MGVEAAGVLCSPSSAHRLWAASATGASFLSPRPGATFPECAQGILRSQAPGGAQCCSVKAPGFHCVGFGIEVAMGMACIIVAMDPFSGQLFQNMTPSPRAAVG